MHKISIKALLTIVMSFILIAVFVPLTFIVYTENNEIHLLREEQIGTAIFPKLQLINILLGQHRGTANRFLNGDRELIPVLTELENHLDSTFTEHLAECQAQIIVLPCERLSTLQAKWQSLKTTYLTLTVRENFSRHTLLITDMLAYSTNIADSSNLSLDSQLATYYLMNSMVENLPYLMENIGQLRGFASVLLLPHHVISTSEQVEIAKLVHSVRLSIQTVNLQLEKVFTVLPAFEQTQRENLQETNHQIEQFLLTFEQHILQNKDSVNNQALYIQASDVITQIMTLYTSVVDELNQALNQRVNDLLQKRYFIVANAFLLISLLIGFLFHFKKRLRVLNHAIVYCEQLSVENYNHPIEIEYHDEIGQLLFALNVMRYRLANNVEALKHSVSRLTEAQRIAQLGDWDWNVQTNELHCSDEGYRILDITENLVEWCFERFLNRITTSDRENVTATFTHAERMAGNYDVEYRVDCKNGKTKMIHQRIESRADATGKIVRMIGTLQDVTIQREMETKIRLAAQVFDHIGEAIVVTDENNNITLINNVFTEITGYSSNEVLGRNPNFLSSGKQNADFYLNMWNAINEQGFWKGEVWNQRKDGTIYPEMLTITTMRNAYGKIINHIGIFSDITLQKRATEQIEYLAHYDSLTGLMNRMALQEAFQLTLASTQKNQQLLALLFIDLDGFKAVNDNLGHDVGDEVLKITAERLRKNVRERDLIARLGGDEFVVVLTHLTETHHIIPIADKLLHALNQTLTGKTKNLSITPSIGIAVYSDTCNSYEKLLISADKAMYMAKTHGKNNYQFAT